jgi:hypothetical protein
VVQELNEVNASYTFIDSAKPIVDRAPRQKGEKVGAMMKLQDAQGGRLATFGAGGERAVIVVPQVTRIAFEHMRQRLVIA